MNEKNESLSGKNAKSYVKIQNGIYKFFTIKPGPPIILVLIFFTAFLLEFSSFWWLAFVAGCIGGLMCKKGYIGFVLGFIGVLLAWGLHLIIRLQELPLDALNALLSKFQFTLNGLKVNINLTSI
ncbi:MAG: hypothetical protein ACTSWN_06290, partial [Promethearchaeota archaeon]